jgi:hypothetical protein
MISMINTKLNIALTSLSMRRNLVSRIILDDPRFKTKYRLLDLYQWIEEQIERKRFYILVMLLKCSRVTWRIRKDLDWRNPLLTL